MQNERNRAALWLSRVLVLVSLLAAALTVRLFCPEAPERLLRAAGLEKDGAASAAFSALKQALQEGQNAVAAFAESCRTLTDAEN